MSKHTDFILSPITEILEDAVSAISGIGSGIETFPICDYIMQSVLLKMTGHQEQKMKCICWEIATYDYEYRYEFTRTPLGECSTYRDKQGVYKDLLRQLKKYNPSFNPRVDIDKTEILQSTTSYIIGVFSNTNLAVWTKKSFDDYITIWNTFTITYFSNDDTSLFAEVNNGLTTFRKIYEEHLYKSRNRIAHNTTSYQQNLPTLKTLFNDDYKYDNYFLYFSLLTLIDKIFIELYKKLLVRQQDNVE